VPKMRKAARVFKRKGERIKIPVETHQSHRPQHLLFGKTYFEAVDCRHGVEPRAEADIPDDQLVSLDLLFQ
jgi:hypothetical protein